jgi:hypothetical protein
MTYYDLVQPWLSSLLTMPSYVVRSMGKSALTSRLHQEGILHFICVVYSRYLN